MIDLEAGKINPKGRTSDSLMYWTFENWTEVLGSKPLAGAVLDRWTHRCHIIEMSGKSYRLKGTKRRHETETGPASQNDITTTEEPALGGTTILVRWETRK